MKVHRYACIAFSAIASAFAQEPMEDKVPPPPVKPPGEGGPRPGEGGPKVERRGKDHRGRDWMAEMWKKADTDGDGFISTTEFAAMERPGRLPEEKRAGFFKRLDKNSDGRIGPDEMPKKPPGGMPPFEKLEHVDADKDGRIVFEEFQKLGFVARLPEDRRRGLFERMDKDHDGALTSADRTRGGPPWDGKRDGKGGRGPSPLELIGSLDKNGDGALGFDEFRQAGFLKDKSEDEQEDRFEEMDRNKDLKLDATDFPPPGEPKPEPPAPDKGP